MEEDTGINTVINQYIKHILLGVESLVLPINIIQDLKKCAYIQYSYFSLFFICVLYLVFIFITERPTVTS